jgi:uncharacterized membrane protein YoaK (UPF0700 family)
MNPSPIAAGGSVSSPATGPASAAPTTPTAASSLDACLLSFVAAFVDTCGYVGLFGIFTAHVTGNFVLMGSEIVHAHGEVLAKLLSFPVFILAVALTVVLTAAMQRRQVGRIGPLLWLEAILLLAAVALAAWLGPPQRADDMAAIAVGMVMVVAMGLQNALMRLELPTMPPTTVMTGNVTQATIDIMTLWSSRRSGSEAGAAASQQRLKRMWPPIVAFLVGAAGGAGGFLVGGFWCLVLPALACAMLAIRLSR